MARLIDEQKQNPPQRRVLGETTIIKKHANFKRLAAERAIRHSCHIKLSGAETQEEWSQSMRLVKLATNPFNNGTLRYVYYMQVPVTSGQYTVPEQLTGAAADARTDYGSTYRTGTATLTTATGVNQQLLGANAHHDHDHDDDDSDSDGAADAHYPFGKRLPDGDAADHERSKCWCSIL